MFQIVVLSMRFEDSASLKLIMISGAVLLLSSCHQISDSNEAKYYTWDGLEPDKWASVWLVNRNISPESNVTVLPFGARLGGAIAIDTPNALYKRSAGLSTFENLLAGHSLQDDLVLQRIGQIINHIEVSPWTTPEREEMLIVENQYRALQIKYNRVQVPIACYSGFFDRLYKTLKMSSPQDLDSTLLKELDPDAVCRDVAPLIAKHSQHPVLEYPIENLLTLINAGKNIIFVDTRESLEYTEGHIPGAINLRLRDVDASVIERFAHADLVISYCIKDFRGYEVAIALHNVGVKTVGIMKPYGISGWMDRGLPITQMGNQGDKAAMVQLKNCAMLGKCPEPLREQG